MITEESNYKKYKTISVVLILITLLYLIPAVGSSSWSALSVKLFVKIVRNRNKTIIKYLTKVKKIIKMMLYLLFPN